MISEQLLAKRISIGGKNRLASVIAVTGVSCSVVVMLLTLSIASGFKDQIKEKLSGFVAQVSVLPPYDYDLGVQETYLEIDSTVERFTSEHAPANVTRTLVLRQPGIIKTADDFTALIFTTYGANHDYTFERENMVEGRLPDFSKEESEKEIVISKQAADRLNLKTGDVVRACFFIDDKIKARRFTIAGLYSSNFGDYDKTVAYGNQKAFQQLCGLGENQGTALEMRGYKEEETAEAAASLQEAFTRHAAVDNTGKVYVADSINRAGATYLNWLDLLDTNVYVIFTLMCCVTMFTLISCLFILILNSIGTIGILRALGMNKSGVRRVFILVAMRLVGLGAIIGNIVGLGLICAQMKWGIVPLDPEMYYLSQVPAELSWKGTVLINIGIIAFSWAILTVPARLASSISPAKTMRYE